MRFLLRSSDIGVVRSSSDEYDSTVGKVGQKAI